MRKGGGFWVGVGGGGVWGGGGGGWGGGGGVVCWGGGGLCGGGGGGWVGVGTEISSLISDLEGRKGVKKVNEKQRDI